MNEFTIPSESPSVHWPDINVKGKRVLDLGCGRWEATEVEETTPHYFLQEGAEFVAGVDSSEDETKYFRLQNLPNTKFATLKIEHKNTLLQIIENFNINVIKSDIEGKEILFLDCTKEELAKIDSLYIEYHGHYIREKLEDKLPALGFTIIKIGKLWVDGFGVIFAERI
jgi:SAM-dependent methyltransferase